MKLGAMIPAFMIRETIWMFFWGIRSVIPEEMRNESIDYGEWKNGVRVEGVISSVMGFSQKVGSGVGSAILGFLMGMSGYISSEAATVQPDSALNMIRFLFNGLPTLLAAGCFVLSLFYTIDKVSGKMHAELSQKTAEQ